MASRTRSGLMSFGASIFIFAAHLSSEAGGDLRARGEVHVEGAGEESVDHIQIFSGEASDRVGGQRDSQIVLREISPAPFRRAGRRRL